MTNSSPNDSLHFVSEFSPIKLIMLDGGVTGEMQTGKQIYDSLRDMQDFGKIPKFTLQRVRVKNVKQLKDELQKIGEDARPGVGLIVHLEFHGDKHGIEVGDDRERIPWKELMSLLSDINKRTNCNLGIVLAGCDGFGSFKVEDLQEPVAFYFQLSKQGKIFPEALKASLTKFYEVTFSEKNVAAGAKAANPFQIKFAEQIFADLLYRVCHSASRRRLKDNHIEMTLNSLLARGGISGSLDVAENRKAIRTHYDSYEMWVRRCIESNMSFFCGRKPAYTIDDLTKWIVGGETLS